MRYPAIFVNHGGGPLPLLGHQPKLARHMKEVVNKLLPEERPKAILVVSAHFEADPITVTSSEHPPMLFDYYGFPSESYEYSYPAPGSPSLAGRIQQLLKEEGLDCELDPKRGYDHGVFVPLLLMYPDATVPVVQISLHRSLSASKHIALGKALAPLRDEGVLILGSGYTFHNLEAVIRNPTRASYKASEAFNDWLKGAMASSDPLIHLRKWASAPGARFAHPREEHLLPLLVTAATGGKSRIIYDHHANREDHACSGYLFE